MKLGTDVFFEQYLIRKFKHISWTLKPWNWAYSAHGFSWYANLLKSVSNNRFITTAQWLAKMIVSFRLILSFLVKWKGIFRVFSGQKNILVKFERIPATNWALNLIGKSYESNKYAKLYHHRGAFFHKTQWEGVKLTDWCQFSPTKKFGNYWYKVIWQNLILKGQGVESDLPHTN